MANLANAASAPRQSTVMTSPTPLSPTIEIPAAVPPGPQHPDVLTRAQTEYPFIKQFNPQVKISPRTNAGYAETFGPDEPGAGKFMRPKEFPMGTTGIEIYRPDKFTHHDLAAEFLHVDPRAHQTREELMKTFTPRQLKIMKSEPDYTYSIKTGQSRERAMQNMTDAVLRGYTVGQWPKKAIDSFGFTDQQRQKLDALKNYMTGKEDK